MNGTMDNLEDRIANLEMVFAYLKNKKMLVRQKNKPNKETPSSDDTADEDIAEFEVASKSKSSTSKPKIGSIRRKKIPNLEPPAGIFANYRRRFRCEFVSLNPRLESRKSSMDCSFTLGSNEEADHVKILQFSNGLLLGSGSGSPAFYYVYNPSTNLFKRLPQPENSHDDSHLYVTGVLRMAFDPTKSRDYKVVQLFACLHAELEIQVYSLETSNWSLCKERLIIYNFAHFATSIYRNDAFHWLETEDIQLTLYKFNIDDHDHPIIRTLQIHNRLHQGSNFLQSLVSGSYDPIFKQINISSILHMQGRFFESHDYLLLVCRDDIDSREFTKYEKMKGCSLCTVRCNKIPNLDPLVGIFANHRTRLFKYEFVSLDPRLESCKSAMDNSFTIGSYEADHVRILQSCNGLLLCSGWGSPVFYYIYNPSTNMFKRLPQPENSPNDSYIRVTGVLRMAFDPTKSCDYTVVKLFVCLHGDLKIQVYSSEKSNWSPCKERLICYNFAHFTSLIYWNDAFHWPQTKDRQLTLYKLNIDDHHHPIITTLETHNGLNQGRNFLQSFGGREGSYDPMFIQIYISDISLLQSRLFESRRCLLLVCGDDIDPKEFTIYEMVKGCLVKTVRKYMFEIILHQQRTLYLLKQKKLMQTQEDHSNPIPALNVDSLKVYLVVIQNTCSKKEDSNSETASNKSVKESSLDSTTKDVHAIKYKMVNKRQMQMQESKIDTGKAVNDDLVVTECIGTESEVQDDNSRSWNDTDADDADIMPIYDEEPVAEVQLTAKCNIFAIGQQHTKQPEVINEGSVDQYPKQRQVKSPMLDSSPDNQTNDDLKQSLESENISQKYCSQFQKDF
nr:hypothetical protein [Tanacetum cinerariifolium]